MEIIAHGRLVLKQAKKHIQSVVIISNRMRQNYFYSIQYTPLVACAKDDYIRYIYGIEEVRKFEGGNKNDLLRLN